MDELESLIYSQFLSNCHRKELESEVKTKNMELESLKLKEVELEIELKDIKVEEINRKVSHIFFQFGPFTFYYCL